MPDISYVNPKIKNISQKELSIQVSLSGFSFLIKAAESGECLAFKSYKFEHIALTDELIRHVSKVLAEDKYLKESYENSELFFISQKATLIPKEYFNPENLKAYFEFNHTLNEYDELNYSFIPAIEAYSVYSLPNLLTNSFYSAFPNISFKQQQAKIVEYGKSIRADGYQVVVGIFKDFFDLAIFEEQQLLLYNSFQYTNAIDFIYFLMYPLNQLKIDKYNQKITVLGDVINHKSIISEIRHKVGNVAFPEAAKIQCKPLNMHQSLDFFTLFL